MDWRLRLLAREEIAEQTTAFYLEKPPNLRYAPGQFVDLGLVDLPEWDEEGKSRSLTIASAPCEGRLLFAMRMRNTPYKRRLGALPLGSELIIDEPEGAFTLQNDARRPAVFLAGGIGVTPFRSMIRQSVHERLQRRLFLFYSNRRPEDAAFLEELRALAREHEWFRFIPTMTQPWQSRRGWTEETEYIGPELIGRHVGALAEPVYYLAGPPAMIQSVNQALVEAGVNRSDINADPFDGY
ncbi:MAG: FAD-dependent oxidoreductase [Acidobacteria bacterium]|nr:MAG: FAD-dependent oxidoreductase [Acidobacteriota bacterium]